jgi:hypothetical protein
MFVIFKTSNWDFASTHTTQSKLLHALETNHRVITPIRKGSKGFDLDGPLNQTLEKALMSSKKKRNIQ